MLAVIPGPHAPKNLEPYFCRTMEELRGLFGNEMEVTQLGRAFLHRPVVVACLADGQARVKVGNFVGLLSKIGACCWCWWEGIYIHGEGRQGGAVRHMGYAEPQEQTVGAK